MLLSVAMIILLSPRLCTRYSDYAAELRKAFVTNAGELYGRHRLTYNLHGMVHLADEAKVYGPLDNVSAFVFENYLGRLKKFVRSPHAPLQQAVKRLLEGGIVTEPVPVNMLQKEHYEGPLPANFTLCSQYKEYHRPQYKVTVSKKNNCVLIVNDVTLVRNFVTVGSDQYVVFQKFKSLIPYFKYPCDSSRLEIYCVSQLEKELQYAPISQVRQKCVIFSWANNTVVLPLLHQLGFQKIQHALKVICNDFLVVKVNCWSHVFNIPVIQPI